MKIMIYLHGTPINVLEPNEPQDRLCVCLMDDKEKFIDSFDWKASTDQIRFYGDSKHYDWNNVPKYKLKLWKTSDLRVYLYRTFDV